MNISLKLKMKMGKTYSDGRYPIQLQYIVNRVPVTKVEFKCFLHEWDEKKSRVKKTMDNSAFINNMFTQEYNKAERDLFKLQVGEKKVGSLFEKKAKTTLSDCLDLELSRLE